MPRREDLSTTPIDGRYPPTDTRDMDPVVYWLPIWTAIVLSRVYQSLGPTRHGWFVRRFPARRAQDLAEILVWSIAWSLWMPAIRLGDRYGAAWMLLFFVPLALGAAGIALLSRRARLAGEPTWSAWKLTLPARPDR